MSNITQRARDTYELERSPSRRKKQRLSSPTYDEQYELSQDQITAFDEFERALTQRSSTSPKSPPKPSQALTPRSRRKRNIAIALALKENVPKDSENLVTSTISREGSPKFKSAKTAGLQLASAMSSKLEQPPPKLSGFSSASALTVEHSGVSPTPSPEAPPEPDLAAWFASSDVPTAGFASAKALVEEKNDDDWFTAPAPIGAVGFQSVRNMHAPLDAGPEASQEDYPGFTKPTVSEEVPVFTGFTTGSNLFNPAKAKAKTLMPSAEALAKAAQRLAQWDKEFDDEVTDTSIVSELREEAQAAAAPNISFGGFSTAGAIRPVLGAMENSFSDQQPPNTPSPAGPSGLTGRSFSPLVPRGTGDKKKEFKSPLLTTAASRTQQASSTYVSSPLKPKFTSGTKGFVPPTRVAGPSTPVRPVAPISSPKKSLGVTPRRPTTSVGKKPMFSTPFKTGMRPGEPGRAALDTTKIASLAVHIVGSGKTGPPVSKRIKGKGRATYFDLSPPGERQPLATCGLRPQSYEQHELEEMGININELRQIAPETALYYSFHTPSSTPVDLYASSQPSDVDTLGTTAALNELHNAGCSLATKQWVENHWVLILWKLAGMVCLDPESEMNPGKKRWCWREVMSQLRYRYERELNNASRPPLRLIAAQDSPASLPMILCISKIAWISSGVDEHGQPNDSIPDVEATDGWYMMRIEVDEPLKRALRKGKLRMGSKIAIAGARLSAGRKDAAEILEAGDSLSLRICGNSSHFAPWHAKLGFQRDPFVATLGSLTADGGVTSVLDVTIEKVYPVAYLEFVETESGDRKRVGPMNEKEEAAAQDKWLAKRDAASAKLHHDIESKLHTLAGYADRLERKAGNGFRPSSDASSPNHIDDLLCDLEDGPDANDVIRRTTPTDAGWLARAIKEKCQKDRECMHEDVNRELAVRP
ncbi:hypothetical protein BDY19DRAFT_901619 [Irpex rosettiformis]|uniref:Uncharacterized protein n=1 Tax=Irpex rosettiformis TaxID=378272 RepID=A0ACB8UJ10_9APHY|nr:hypothetical protein BDY19DRAFT_901619 [Irpex rosettiformis]